MTRVFLTTRFEAAVELSGLTKAELARRAGITASRLSQFAKAPPTDELVARMATALNVSPSFFGREDEFPTVAEPFYRRVTKTPAGVRNRYRAIAGLIGAAIRRSGLPRPPRRMPDLHDLPADAAAVAFRTALGLQPEEPMLSMIRVLESHGAWVFELATDDYELVDAFCTTVDGIPLVFLNPVKADPYRTRHNAGHELCHLTRHDEPAADGPERAQQEHEANTFGGELLLPSRVWADLAPRHGLTNPWTYLSAKQRFGISVKALMYKTKVAGLMTDSEHRYASIRYSQMGWNNGEPEVDEDETEVSDRPRGGARLLEAFGSIESFAAEMDVSFDLAHTVLGAPRRPTPRPYLRLV